MLNQLRALKLNTTFLLLLISAQAATANPAREWPMDRAQIGDRTLTLYGAPDLETSVRPTSFHLEDENGSARFVIVSTQALPYGTVKYIAYENELNPDRRVEVIDQKADAHLPASNRWAVKIVDKTGTQTQYAGNIR